MTDSGTVRYEVTRGSAVLTIDNPTRRNAMTYPMIEQMYAHLETAADAAEVADGGAPETGLLAAGRDRFGKQHNRTDDFVVVLQWVGKAQFQLMKIIG